MGADKSLARPTSRYILFDGENISFDASLVLYIYIYIYIYIYVVCFPGVTTHFGCIFHNPVAGFSFLVFEVS